MQMNMGKSMQTSFCIKTLCENRIDLTATIEKIIEEENKQKNS